MRDTGINAAQPREPTPLNLEASPPNEVKLQVPAAGGQLWAALNGTDLAGAGAGPLRLHLAGKAPVPPQHTLFVERRIEIFIGFRACASTTGQ